ncbi:MAG: hypothetical protein ABEH43_05735, partial [Flavobacteriales bacterium]
CNKFDSLTVNVSSNPVPNLELKGDTSICKNEKDSLYGEITNVSSGSSFDFNSGIDTSYWDTSSASLNTACGSMSGDAVHFEGPSSMDRLISTKPLNLNNCDSI